MIINRIKILCAGLQIVFVLLALALVLPGCKNPEIQTSVITETISSQIIVETQVGPTSDEESATTETTDQVLFSFAVSGDSRAGDDVSPIPPIFIDILSSIKKFNPAFYISTGDIINGGSNDPEIIKRQFSDYLKVISILNCPTYVSAGNHEIQKDTGRKTFDELFGNNGKTYYYFEYQNTFFIILDAYEGGNWGAIKKDELSWLQNLLQSLKEEKVFVFLHPPVYSFLNPDCITDGSKPISFSDKENQDEIRRLFKDTKVDGVFSGHEHMFHMQMEENTEYIITALSGASPYVSKEEGGFYHFLIIDVKENSWVLKVMDANGDLIEKNVIDFN